jgi:hypothetical protein
MRFGVEILFEGNFFFLSHNMLVSSSLFQLVLQLKIFIRLVTSLNALHSAAKFSFPAGGLTLES